MDKDPISPADMAHDAPALKPTIMPERGSFQAHTENLKSAARDKLHDAAHKGIQKTSEILDNVAATMGDTAQSLEGNFGKLAADYARKAASTVADAAEKVKAQEAPAMVEQARLFATEKPLLVAGAAAALGFALTRIFRATSPQSGDAAGE
jgi:ElaB/YqjD/DUF883 family membrane-anchored ribosome-binding protein